MKWGKSGNWGMLLLGVWLIASGLTPFVNIGFLNMRLILAVLGIAAGVLILLGR